MSNKSTPAPFAKKPVNPEVTTGGATVTVGCKLPMGLKLQLHRFVERHEAVLGGGVRTVKIAEAIHKSPVYILNGNSFPQNMGAQCQITGGYAFTYGIPKAFMEEWLEQNADADYVANKMIIVQEDIQSMNAEATELKDVKSGMERLDPTNLPKGIETSDETRRAA